MLRIVFHCSAGADELESAVRRFRSLRESLVAAYVRDDLAIQVRVEKWFTGDV